MIAVVDIETKGLDARKFVTACIMKENGTKKHFYKKEDLWNYILELGKRESKRKKVLNLYAHNHEYDFYGYADLNDSHLKFFCFRPFIASYEINGIRNINFLDSYAIFKMSLKRLGEIIGLEKMELPIEFEKAQRISKKRIKEVAPYVERDVEIVMKSIKLMKSRMNKEGVQLRRLYTISQIAIAYLMNNLKRRDDCAELFFNRDRGMFHRTRYRDLVHEAYRGGRCECFQLGDFKQVDYIDCNNLYGFSSTRIRFPNLITERLIKNPRKFFSISDILREIGICRAMVFNKSNKIGLLPVRTGGGNYYPKEGTYLIGTWTNLELRKALKEGYEVINIEWSLIWDEIENPFKEITPRLYELRKESGDSFSNFFYKEMQNRSYGKLAQRKSGQEIIIDSVEEARKYLKDSWEIIRGSGLNYMYQKNKVEDLNKSYYAPIIPTLINAYARVFMYDVFKVIPLDSLIYTDTDSCIMKIGHLNKFNIGKKLGEFKVEFKSEECIIKGRKTYAIGDEIKVSGFRKRDVSLGDFKKGVIRSKRMNTLKTAKDLRDVGGFLEEVRDLDVQLRENKEVSKLYRNQKVFKDKNINNINYFHKDLIGIVK